MCPPVILAVMVVASMAAAAYSANQSKHAVEDQLNEQQKQVDQQSSAQMEDRIKAARETRATARAAAAESGVAGSSADAVLSDVSFQASRDVSRIEKNRENGFNEASVNAKARYSEINGQLAQSIASSASTAASAYGSKSGKT